MGPSIWYPLLFYVKRNRVWFIKMDGTTSILTIAVAFYIGSALTQFFNSVMSDLINPVLAAALSVTGSPKGGFVISIGSVKLEIGDFIAAVGNLAIAMIVVSMTLPYIRAYAPIGGRR